MRKPAAELHQMYGEETMDWYRDLYVGNTFQKEKRKIRRMVRNGKSVPELRLILLRRDVDTNQLEVVSQDYLAKYYVDTDALLIVGIASGDAEARDLLVQITDTVYRKSGTAQLRKYFLEEG